MTTPEARSIRKAYHEELSILVVEDYMVFYKEVKHALPEHRMVFARTVEEAKLRYEECLPNITFLDINLPDGDGFELLDHIRGRDPTAFVVILSGSKLDADVAMAHAKGAQGYIIKPFTRAMIKQYIDQYTDMREKTMKSLLETGRQRPEDTPPAP